ELRNDHRPRLRILLAGDDDAVDGAGAFACEASCAYFEIDLEDAAVAEGQRVLDADRDAIGILDGVGLAHEVRSRHGHPLEDRGDGILDILNVGAKRAHIPNPKSSDGNTTASANASRSAPRGRRTAPSAPPRPRTSGSP